MTELSYTKLEARKLAMTVRNSLHSNEVLEHSASIFEKIMQMESYQTCDTILAYADCKHEVMTREFIDRALEDGKRMALPRVEKSGIMDFFYIESRTDLVTGKFGISEPVGNQKFSPKDSRSVIMIMPGVAFDEECHRVGYGGGYYDRYLMRYPEIATIAVCHEVQLMKKIITEEYDICPDVLITEKRTLYKHTCI